MSEASVAPEMSHQVTEQKKKVAAAEHAVQARQKQTLGLQREHILSQRTSNEHRRAALKAALEQVEAQLAALN